MLGNTFRNELKIMTIQLFGKQLKKKKPMKKPRKNNIIQEKKRHGPFLSYLPLVLIIKPFSTVEWKHRRRWSDLPSGIRN